MWMNLFKQKSVERKIKKLNIQKELYPLTQAQSRIWYAQLLNMDEVLFNIGGLAMIHGDINVDILVEAIKCYVDRNDSFKIHIIVQDDIPMQFFDEEHRPVVNLLDISNETNPEEFIKKWANEKIKIPFQIENSRLYDFYVFKINRELCGYFIKLHHMIGDGWSTQLLTEGISKIYEMLTIQKELENNFKSSYKDFIVTENNYLLSKSYQKDKQFWNKVYSKEVEFNSKRDSSTKGKRIAFRMEDSLSYKIKEFCKNYSISENAFFISIYVLFENKISGRENIILGVPFVGRNNRTERYTFGMFVSTILARFEVEGASSIIDFMKEVKSQINLYYLHNRYPYNHLVKDIGLATSPISLTSINYYGTTMCKDINNHPVEYIEVFSGHQDYDLQLIIREWGEKSTFEIDFDYKVNRYSEAQVADLFQLMNVLIEKVLSNPNNSIKDTSLLQKRNKNRLLYEFNNTDGKLLIDKSIVTMFDQQVQATPDRIAIQCIKETLTYLELEKKAERIAAFLQEKEVRSNDFVAVMMKHSLMSVAVIMGILKSGAAYLPIDPKWPNERVTFILKDAEVKIVLSDCEQLDRNDDEIQFYHFNAFKDDKPIDFIRQEIDVHTLAYCIYTSGSTGNPKGVMIEHKSIANYITFAKETYVSHDVEVFPLYSSFAFDLTMTSIFTPIVCGGTILVYEEDESEYVLYRILRENLCTIMKLTPAHLKLLKMIEVHNLKIKKLIVGGDDLKTALCSDIYHLFN